MKPISSFVKKYSLVIFFLLAYAISWLLPAYFPLGPFIAAIVVAALTGGLKDLLLRCLRWRVGPQWYAAALFVPAFIGSAVVALSILLGAPAPSAAQLGPWYSLLMLFPVALVDAPLFEEPGWRGFALPRFSAARSPLANSLLLGVLVVGWHIPRALADPGITVPYLLAGLGSAVLTNWVFYNARGSALLAILYHTAANTFGLYFSPMFTGADHVRYYWLLAAVNVVLAVAVVLVTGPELRGYVPFWKTIRSGQPRPLK